MSFKGVFQIPFPIWLKALKYYLFRLLRLPVSDVESNWVYFLRLALPANIKISQGPYAYIIDNPLFKHRVKVRKGDSSDIFVYIQIFFHDEYNPLVKFLKAGERLHIVDAGSNVGFFAAYANFFSPNSVIYCIEPSADNCLQIRYQETLNNFKNWKVEQAALWHEDTFLEFVSLRDNREWNYSVFESKNGGNIETITLSKLLDKYGMNEIDIFKMDIEGSEAKLFADNRFLELLKDKVRVLAIETHDASDKESIINLLELNNFIVEQKGELLFANKV